MQTSNEKTPLLLSQNIVPAPYEDSISLESIAENKLRKRSLNVAYLTAFIGSVSFSICISSIWPYLTLLDRKSTSSFLGWVVGSYSLGQAVASPILGWLSKRLDRALVPLILAISINLVGSVFYCYLEELPQEARQPSIIVARVLVGCGGGVVAVLRSYVSQATTLEERTKSMTFINAAQALGFILGPALQAACAFLSHPGPVEEKYFHLNIYTAPGWIGVLIGFMNILLLVIYFKEFKIADETAPTAINSSQTVSINSDAPVLPKLDILAAVSLIGIFFVALCVFSLSETLLTPLVMDEYAYKKEDATVFVGIGMAVAGLLSIFGLVLMQYLLKKLDARMIFIGAFVLCALAYVVWLPWGNTYPDIKPGVNYESSKISTTLVPEWLDLDEFELEDLQEISSNRSAITPELVGCDFLQKPWCRTVPKINIYQLIFGFTLSTVGYPVTTVLANTFFSKVLGAINQGLWMGWLTAAGSMARFLGPLLMGFLYGQYGPRIIFIVMATVLFSTIIYIIFLYRRLVPRGFRSPPGNRNTQQQEQA